MTKIGPETELIVKTTDDRLFAKGEAEGRAKMLIRQLEARFGPLDAERVARVAAGIARRAGPVGASVRERHLQPAFLLRAQVAPSRLS